MSEIFENIRIRFNKRLNIEILAAIIIIRNKNVELKKVIKKKTPK